MLLALNRICRSTKRTLIQRTLLAALLFCLMSVATVIAFPYTTVFAQQQNSLYLPLASGGDEAGIIPNQYIVVLQEAAVAGDRPVAISVVDQANALTAQYGGSVLYTYDT